jgi:hypothetical protein
LKYKGGEPETFKVMNDSRIEDSKKIVHDVETKTGSILSKVGTGLAGVTKILAYNLPKAAVNLGTDLIGAQLQVFWRFFKNNKIVVFGLFGFREAQLEQYYNNERIQLLEGGMQSRISDDLTDFDDYKPPHKEWIYPNFHDKIKNEENVYVTPIGIGSVFAIKRSKIINFAKSFLPGKTNKPDEIVDIYSPTGYYIVVRITKSAEFPAEIHYREIRYGFPDYYIGKKRYVISRIKNTVRLWRQIRVYELNFDKLNDTGKGNDRSAVIVRRKTTGGGDTDNEDEGETEAESISSRTGTSSNNRSDTSYEWVKKFSKQHNKPYWVNKTNTNIKTWDDPKQSESDKKKSRKKTHESKNPSDMGNTELQKSRRSRPRNSHSEKPEPEPDRPPSTQPFSSIDEAKQPPVDESNDGPQSDDDDDQTVNQPIKQKKFAWEFEWIKINNDQEVLLEEKEDFTQYKNKYTGELVKKNNPKASNITSDTCNILCYMTNNADNEKYRNTYCFNNTVIPIANMKNFHKFIIYFRHISNIANWIQNPKDEKYYYVYDINMKKGLTACHFLPASEGNSYFEMKEDDKTKRNFFKDELFGEDGLSCDGQAIMDKFSITDEAFNEYKIREKKRLLALQQYSKPSP